MDPDPESDPDPVGSGRIRSDPELFAGSGSGVGSGINHFGSGSGQSGSGMNFIPNFSVKKSHFLNQIAQKMGIFSTYIYVHIKYVYIQGADDKLG